MATDASLWQEAFDETSQLTYYYHIETGETSWTLPSTGQAAAEDENDLSYLAFAVVKLQSLFRGSKARRRVVRLLRAQYQTTIDPVTLQTLYTDRRTGNSSWTPPALYSRLRVGGDGDEEEENNCDDDDDFDAFHRDVQQGQAEDGEQEEDGGKGEGDDEDEHLDESGKPSKHKKRRFPRSQAQLRVDAVEDLEDAKKTHTETANASLDMSGLHAWKLSTRIWNLSFLQNLNLSHNELTRIPSGIQDLIHLQHLNVSHNHLTRLPSCLQTTTTLQTLDASHNMIACFSPKLWKLRGLRELRLAWNRLTEVPYVEGDLKLLRDTREWQVGVGLLTQLRVLDLSHNKLTVSPKSIEKCTSLVFLDLSFNKLSTLSHELSECQALEQLLVSHNLITELPDPLGTLANLEILRVDSNRLTTLPESIGNLQALVELDIAHNGIRHLPEQISALGCLQRLRLDGNTKLATLAICLRFLPSVVAFTASKCGLVAFDAIDLLCKAPVETLCLSDNGLMDFPVNLARSVMKKSLKELVLARNSLYEFPLEIATAPCHALVKLDLSFNRLRSLPREIKSLKSLQRLLLSHNLLTELPETIAWLPQLQELRCDHNRLIKLPLAIGFLAKLQHLDVAFNVVTELPTSLLDLKSSLRSLYANDNQLCVCPPVLALLSPSCVVELSNNPFCCRERSGALQDKAPPQIQQLYGEAVRCFYEKEYDQAESLLSMALEIFDGERDDHKSLWKFKKDQLPHYLLLRGLCRFMMLKRDREVIEEASLAIDEYERQLHGDQLTQLRTMYCPSKAIKDTAMTKKLPSSLPVVLVQSSLRAIDNQLAESESERPETTAASTTPTISSNQTDDCVSSAKRLQVEVSRRIEARKRAAAASAGALADLDRAIRLGVPELPTAYNVQGHVYMATLELPLAIESFTAALHCVSSRSSRSKSHRGSSSELDPLLIADGAVKPPLAGMVPILLSRANAYRRLGQLPAALADVQLALASSHHDYSSQSTTTNDHPLDDMAKDLSRQWAVHQSQYFIDHDSLFRAFDVETKSGLARRPEVHDAHIILSASQRHEIKHKTPRQRFAASVDILRNEIEQKTQSKRLEMEANYIQKQIELTKARDFKREIRANLAMEMEEASQRRIEQELARLAELKRQEMDREFNERMYMKYEDEYMKWLVSEEKRIEADRLKREEDARKKAEAKAQYETRLARRGGRRQQLASRGASSTTRATSPVKKMK